MKKNVLISYIIVRYKIKKELYELIKSINQQKISDTEILVVDNNPEERIEKELLAYFPEVLYVANPVNNGMGAGVNLGFKFASGKYIFVLNPDMVLDKNCTKNLLDFYQRQKNVGIVSPSYRLKNGKQPPLQVGTKELNPIKGIIALSILSSVFKNNPVYNDFYIRERDYDGVTEVYAVPGGALFLSASLYKEIHGFDENFFLYFEEHDLSKRVKELGYKNYILGNAKVYHVGGIDSVNLQMTKVFAQSRFYYFKKHYGVISAILVQAVTSLNKYSLGIILLIFIFLICFLFLKPTY